MHRICSNNVTSIVIANTCLWGIKCCRHLDNEHWGGCMNIPLEGSGVTRHQRWPSVDVKSREAWRERDVNACHLVTWFCVTPLVSHFDLVGINLGHKYPHRYCCFIQLKTSYFINSSHRTHFKNHPFIC